MCSLRAMHQRSYSNHISCFLDLSCSIIRLLKWPLKIISGYVMFSSFMVSNHAFNGPYFLSKRRYMIITPFILPCFYSGRHTNVKLGHIVTTIFASWIVEVNKNSRLITFVWTTWAKVHDKNIAIISCFMLCFRMYHDIIQCGAFGKVFVLICTYQYLHS